MFLNILNWIVVKNYRRKQTNIDWENTLEILKNELEGFQYYLDTRSKGLVKVGTVGSNQISKGVLWVVATLAHRYEKPFETKEPTELALSKLKSMSSLNVSIQVSRNPRTFYGYYLYVH